LLNLQRGIQNDGVECRKLSEQPQQLKECVKVRNLPIKSFRETVTPGETTALLAGYPAWIVITAIKNDGVDRRTCQSVSTYEKLSFRQDGIEYSGVLLGIDA
jgi:hypothetical protein